MMHRILVLFSMVTVAACRPVGDDGYTVHVMLPYQVGDRFELAANARLVSDVLAQADDRHLGEGHHVFDVSLHATAEVLEADSKQQPTWIRYTVNSCEARRNDSRIACLKPGAVVEIRKITGNEDPTGIPDDADEGIALLLKGILSCYRPEAPTPTEIYGTEERRAVGDSWKIDGELMQQVDDVFREAYLAGTATLTGITNLHGIDHLQVDVKIEADGVLPPPQAGFTADRVRGTMKMRNYVPIDLENRSHRYELIQDMSAKILADDGTEIYQSLRIEVREIYTFPS